LVLRGVVMCIRLVLISISLLIAGCTLYKQETVAPVYTSPLLGKALSGEAIFKREITEAELPSVDFFFLTDEMKEFAIRSVKGSRGSDAKAEKLHMALMGSRGHAIRYSALQTLTAREVYESRQANCLGYTLLYVSLARYLGLNVDVNQVMVPPAWYMDEQETFFLMQHVNARVKLQRFSWMTASDGQIQLGGASDLYVDLEMRRFRSSYKQKSLSSSQVEAFFYNNRAMELATNGKLNEAFLYLKKALLAQPDEVFVWSNLGALYRRMGYADLAETVYLKALSINQGDLTTLHNLTLLYAQTGREQDAEIYRLKVARYRNENPYYLYQMAIKSRDTGDLVSAKKFIEQALKKQKYDDRFYTLAADIYVLDGNLQKAGKMRAKAESIKKSAALNQYQARI
jgi:Flp pilus assembly protein TadD